MTPRPSRLGLAAHARVLDEFLGDRHLDQYVDLFAGLVANLSRDVSGESRRAPPS